MAGGYNPALPLQPGVRFGSYEIVSAIGAGGMGEVYRAHDPALHRDVALKILPDAFAADPDRLARFTREAQVLATLNHPHIAHVYGLERRDGPDGRAVSFIVMELVEGETLADLITKHAQRGSGLDIDEVIPIALQIAEALEAAHDQGVIHRDLKPANVKVRADGTVKVLDFGLAKALDPSTAGDPMNSPTLTTPALMTRAGIILGTASYMAPEQAKGKAVDKRADIWAFGCVLFEMLTGRPLFGGETITETLAAVLRDTPGLDALPPATPPHIRRLLARCLERDPRQRLRDVGEARIALAGATQSDSPSHAVAPPQTESHRFTIGGVLPWAIAALAMIGAIGAWVTRRPSAPAQLRKLELSFIGANVAGPAISPDGKRIAFLADGHLRVKDLDQLGSRDIGAVPPLDRDLIFWSPDAALVGYATADGKLWKVPAVGGTPVMICAIPETGRLMGAAWRANGPIVLAVWQGNLYQVPSTGGKPTVLAAIDPAKEIDFHYPVIAADDRVLVSTHLQLGKEQTGEGFRVERIDGERRQTVLEAARLQLVGYLDAGYLLISRYDSNPGLWALPFSGRLPLRVDDAFLLAPDAGNATAARDGTLLYSLAFNAPQTGELVWVDRAGQVVGQIGSPQRDLYSPTLSPDGQRVAFSARAGGNGDVWVHDIGRDVQSRLTFEPVDQGAPAWLPSGERVVYSESVASIGNVIVATNADGSGHRQELTKGSSPIVSPDGRFIIYLVEDRGALRLRYSALPASGIAAPGDRVFKTDPEPNIAPTARLSPDGGFLAYSERQPTGEFELFVTRFPSGEGRWQISTGGGRTPRWIRETNELVFVSGTAGGARHMMSVPIAVRPTLVPGPAVKLFDLGEDFTVPGTPTFDVTADGKRFLMIRMRTEAGGRPSSRWVLVQNWLAEFTPR